MTQVRVDAATARELSGASVDVLIVGARGGCSRSLGELAEKYRRYLLHVASQSLSPELRAKVAPSDLVQDTLLHVQQRFGTFDGTTEDDLLRWLRRILYFRALQSARRYYGSSARDLRRELSLHGTGRPLEAIPIPDSAPTPCTGLVEKELSQSLETALAALADDARHVILLRNFGRRSFPEIGQVLGCSPETARKRWVRAIALLRAAMTGHE